MPQAEIIPITTRRKALRIAVAATMAAPVMPETAARADAAVLKLCRQFDADTLALQHYDACVLAGRTPAIDGDEFDFLMDQWHDALAEIVNLSATTMAGIRAKARALGHALRQCAFIDTDVPVDEQGEDYERLAMSLVRDLAATG